MDMTLLDRRRVEAEALGRVYARLGRDMDKEAALAVIRDVVAGAAAEAGRAFAASAPRGPSFEHFKTVLDLWRRGGALAIENVHDHDRSLTFDVTRCDYVRAYRDMGLPEELVALLSCARDEPFARAYDPRLEFSRSQTLALGADRCCFTFTWLE